MKITLAGKIGSGKTSVSKILCEKANLQYFSVGGYMRELAKQKGVNVVELNNIIEKDGGKIDNMLDQRQKDIEKREDDFVMDARLGWFFVPDSWKVYLDVDLKIGAERVFNHKRETENRNNFDDFYYNVKKRYESENYRYKKYYGIEKFDDFSNFDIVLDATNYDQYDIADYILKVVR